MVSGDRKIQPGTRTIINAVKQTGKQPPALKVLCAMCWGRGGAQCAEWQNTSDYSPYYVIYFVDDQFIPLPGNPVF